MPVVLGVRGGVVLLGLLLISWQMTLLRDGLRRGRRLASQAQAFEHRPAAAVAKVLVLGDSTGLGVGAAWADQSLPALLASMFPNTAVVNACINGARVTDAAACWQARLQQVRYDLVLVMAGGNDVIRLTPLAILKHQATSLMAALHRRSRHVVWLGCADLGNAPVLLPPLSWLASWRCRRVASTLKRAAEQQGVIYLDFGETVHSTTFRTRPGHYFAEDGLHPSAAAYRHCFQVLYHLTPLQRWLSGPAVAGSAPSWLSFPRSTAGSRHLPGGSVHGDD